MDEIEQQASKLHKYRLRNGRKSTFPDAYAESLLYALYERKMQKDEVYAIGKKDVMRPLDDSSRTILPVFTTSTEYMLIEPDKEDADVYLFCWTYPGDAEYIGWIPRSEVLECEHAYKMDTRGNRVGVSYKVYSEFLLPMPQTFDFVVNCIEVTPGIWNYDISAWECFSCGRHKPSRAHRERIAALDAELFNQKVEEQKRSKRQSTFD